MTAPARMSLAEKRMARAAPAPARGFVSEMLPVRGLRLHVRQRVDLTGSQPVWLLLHGLAVSHCCLMPTATALPGSVFVPDLPGFGLSGKPAEVLTAEQHAEYMAAWMDTTGLSSVHVLGNSFGGQIAVELAIRRPDLVASLTLVGPTVDPAAPTAGAQIGRWLYDLIHEDPHQTPILVADVRDAGVRRVLRTLKHAVNHHIEHRLPLVTAPVLLMRGQHDPIAPADWITFASSLAGTTATTDIPGAAHNAVTTAGATVAALAAAFADIHPGPREVRHMSLGHNTSTAQTRRWTEQALLDWDMSDQIDDVLLVTTELVQNVTQHTDDGGELTLHHRDNAVLIEVTDTDTRPPRLTTPPPAKPGGRGLLIVAATARRWGSRPVRWAGRTGKTVWAEIVLRARD